MIRPVPSTAPLSKAELRELGKADLRCYTVPEVAEILGCHKMRVNDLIDQRELVALANEDTARKIRRVPGWSIREWRQRELEKTPSVAHVRRSTAPRAISPRRRFAVLERCNFTCTYCGRKAPEVTLVVDHIVPVAKGGTGNDDNLTAACRDCNAGKGARLITRRTKGQ